MTRVLLLLLSCDPAATQERLLAPRPAGGGYARTVADRVAKVVAAVGLTDPGKAARARKAVEAHYLGLDDIHGRRDATVKAAGADKQAVGRARADAEAAVRVLHDRFRADLAAELTPAEVEVVKDGMTYNVVPITYRAYCDMLPGLTEPQKARIREVLKEGREAALVAGSSKEKHETFGRFKGRVNNYLSGQGYDLKKAGQEWAERWKAAGKP